MVYSGRKDALIKVVQLVRERALNKVVHSTRTDSLSKEAHSGREGVPGTVALTERKLALIKQCIRQIKWYAQEGEMVSVKWIVQEGKVDSLGPSVHS